MSCLKFLKDIKNLKNKRALLRVDFNVPILYERSELTKSSIPSKARDLLPQDDFRIRAAIPTIKYLIRGGAKIIIMSHLGRPQPPTHNLQPTTNNQQSTTKAQIQNEKYSLKPIAVYLEKLLKRKVKFLPDCIGEKVEKETAKMEEGEIIMLENLRFYEGEEKDDKEFAKKLAKLGDIYINDAFGVSHRANASVSAITEYLPSCAGLLLEKEIDNLSKILENPAPPCVLVLGGAKIETKLPVLNHLKEKADKILICGAIANVFLKALGFEIGKSKTEEGYNKDIEEIMKSGSPPHQSDELSGIKEFRINLNQFKPTLWWGGKIILPQDVKTERGVKKINNIDEEDKILDIGPETIKLFSHFIKKAQTIIWNGPMGLIEDERFMKGSEEIAKFIAKNRGFTAVGGGETLIVLNKAKVFDKIKFVSTGGGAMLEYLAGKKLPGIEALK